MHTVAMDTVAKEMSQRDSSCRLTDGIVGHLSIPGRCGGRKPVQLYCCGVRNVDSDIANTL